MTEKKEIKTPKRRTQVKDLPQEEKQLSKEEQKEVKGGVFGFEPQPIAGNNRK